MYIRSPRPASYIVTHPCFQTRTQTRRQQFILQTLEVPINSLHVIIFKTGLPRKSSYTGRHVYVITHNTCVCVHVCAHMHLHMCMCVWCWKWNLGFKHALPLSHTPVPQKTLLQHPQTVRRFPLSGSNCLLLCLLCSKNCEHDFADEGILAI